LEAALAHLSCSLENPSLFIVVYRDGPPLFSIGTYADVMSGAFWVNSSPMISPKSPSTELKISITRILTKLSTNVSMDMMRD